MDLHLNLQLLPIANFPTCVFGESCFFTCLNCRFANIWSLKYELKKDGCDLLTSYHQGQGFPGGLVVKIPKCRRHWFDPWVGKIPWRSKWQPTPVFLPGECHGQRSPVGYSLWSRKRVTQDWAPEQSPPSGSGQQVWYYFLLVVWIHRQNWKDSTWENSSRLVWHVHRGLKSYTLSMERDTKYAV